MDDVLFSKPWQGDDECPQAWHKATYWTTGEGYTVDDFTDGDHEDIDVADLPGQREVDDAWLAYSEFVRDSGTDPLGEFCGVRRTVRERQSWSFRFANSLGGPVVTAARFRGAEQRLSHLPPHVREFLCLEGTSYRLRGVDSLRRLGLEPNRWESFSLGFERPRSPEIIVRELRARARKHIRSVKEYYGEK